MAEVIDLEKAEQDHGATVTMDTNVDKPERPVVSFDDDQNENESSNVNSHEEESEANSSNSSSSVVNSDEEALLAELPKRKVVEESSFDEQGTGKISGASPDSISPIPSSNSSGKVVPSIETRNEIAPASGQVRQEKLLEERTSRYLQLRTADSPFFQAHPAASLPVFDTDEITLGCLLGQGEFGSVREVVEVSDKTGHDGLPRLLATSNICSSQHSFRYQLKDNSGENCCDQDTTSAHPNHHGHIVNSDDDQDDDQEEDEEGSIEFIDIETARRARKVLKKRCWREGKARYAVKQLRDDLATHDGKNNQNDNEEQLEDQRMIDLKTIGAMDLAMEAKLLASLSHPNICKLRATAGIPGHPDYMLVLDRLYTTLDEKLEEWRLELPHTSRIKRAFQHLSLGSALSLKNISLRKMSSTKLHASEGDVIDINRNNNENDITSSYTQQNRPGRKKFRGNNSKKANTLRLIRKGKLLHRLYVAYDVARALRYLHTHSIVFRDLKPQNIAFDIRGDVRIFDFGLAKELLKEDLVNLPDDYNGTGMTGSRRWMAPECYFSEPYGLSVDIYSYGLLLWNLCYLQTPYGEKLTPKAHHQQVMVKGVRPERIHSKLISDNLWSLMTLCWSLDRSERPNFEMICEILRKEIISLRLDIQLSTPVTMAVLDATSSTTISQPNPAEPELDVIGACSDPTDQPMNKRFRFGGYLLNRKPGLPGLFSGIAAKNHQKRASETDPVEMSLHGKGLGKQFLPCRRVAKKSGKNGGRRRSSFFPQAFYFRNSHLEDRSDYLMDKSERSLADCQLSSANLSSSSCKFNGSPENHHHHHHHHKSFNFRAYFFRDSGRAEE